ncbi:MAG: hypothetical protein R2932_03555 [Caldilineaceae bacterium]
MLASQSASILTPLTQTGTYSVVVQHLPQTDGALLLTTDLITTSVNALSWGNAVTGTLSASQPSYWHFDAKADR